MHRDFRGAFTEVFRDEWNAGMRPVQWNAVRSDPRVLRGVHVHLRHWDYLSLASGKANIGLRDLRSGSPTEGQSLRIVLGDSKSMLVAIPPGVAHGARNLGTQPGRIIYFVDVQFSPDPGECDEGRLPWDFLGTEIWEVEKA